jgi:uncharacterized protein YjbJ (UPF0337 family)
MLSKTAAVLRFPLAGRRRQENQIMGELTDKAKGIGNKVAGAAKQATGDAANDPALEQEGRAQKTKGTAQQVVGSVKGALGDNV